MVEREVEEQYVQNCGSVTSGVSSTENKEKDLAMIINVTLFVTTRAIDRCL